MRDAGYEKDAQRAQVASNLSKLHEIPARSRNEPVGPSLFFLNLAIRDGFVALTTPTYVVRTCSVKTCLA